MSFLKRLYYFLFGTTIGIIILMFVLDKKESTFNYGLDKRVLNDIYKKEWLFEKDNERIIKDKKNFFKTYDVNFSKSNVKLDSCKIYILEKKLKNQTITFQVENCKKNANFKRIK
ncbi:MAG: hypothetical protein ACKVJS_00880 [Flavobacteriales bacterium]|jgi:hypothetical protein|tara:strand:- start:4266 stop:4610 length:345 start_codon:yes stop_codon:yes gene_type:complete